LGKTEFRIGPFLLVTVTIQIQYSLWVEGREEEGKWWGRRKEKEGE
jgi:hypothetical protein